MKTKFFIFFSLIYLSTPTNVISQEHEQISYKLLDINETRIKAPILIDNNGFLWYRTTNGILIDYGKTKTKIPLHCHSTEFYDNNMFQDKSGHIWIGCSKGAYVINPNNFKTRLIEWKPENSKTNTGFVDFIQQKDGTIWIVTESNHLIGFNDFIFLKSYKVPTKRKERTVLALLLNKKGEVLICENNLYSNNDLFRLNNNDIEHITNMPYRSILFLLPEEFSMNKTISKGDYYSNGLKKNYAYNSKIDAYILYKFQENNYEGFNYPFLNKYNSVVDNNTLIYKTINTIQFDEINIENNIISFTKKFSIKFEEDTGKITLNKNRDLIISTSNKITKVKLGQNTNKGYTQFLKNYESPVSTRSILTDSLNIYINSYSGLFKISNNNKELVYKKEIFNHMIKENDTIVWGISGHEIKKINLNTGKDEAFKSSFYSDLVEFKNENEIWVGTGQGLYLFNKNTSIYSNHNQLNEQYNIKDYYIKSLLQQKDSTLWIGTNTNGALFCNQKTKEITHYNKNNSEHYIPHDKVFDFHKDKNNNFWIAGDKGLTFIDKNNKTKTFTTTHGLSNLMVCGILETKNYLWVSTYGGINRIDISDSILKRDPKIDYFLYDIEFNHKSLLKLNDSTLFFGSVNGVYKINTNKISFKKSKVNIHPISLKTYDKITDTITEKHIGLNSLKKINLEYNHNYFEIKFAINNSFDYKKNKYQYKIDGLTPSWISLDNENAVRQYGIPPGKYILRISGKNDVGEESLNTIVIPIYVSEVFYKTTSFTIISYIILILIGFVLVYLWFYRKNYILKKNNKVKELELKALRLQMNPHFIFNTINGIQSDLIFKNTEEINDHIHSFSKILRTTMDMTLKNTISLQQELEYLEAYIKLQLRRLHHDFLCEIKITSNQYNIKNIEIPSMLFQPLIENAIIHGLEPKKEKEKFLTLNFKLENNILIGSVDDNGVGRKSIKPKNNYKSHALRIMMSRISINNQMKRNNIYIKTIDKGTIEKPLGTKVILKIPFD